MIAQFPLFSPLKIAHRDEVTAITSRFDPYSDFNFTSLYCWNTDGSTEIAMLNDNLIIKLPDYITGKPVVSMLGDSRVDESLQTLLAVHEQLKLVPETVVRGIEGENHFAISEDADNFDYIYNTSDIAFLPGGDFKKKRNKVSSVQSALTDRLEVATIRYIDGATKRSIRELFGTWASNPRRDIAESESHAEQKALDNLLDHADSFNLLVTTVTVDGRLAAFSINEKIDDDYAICHFEKALPVHDQIYSFVANQAAKGLLDNTCKYMNWEQDLGLPGLRKSKQAFLPVRLLKKYTVSLN